MAVANTPGLAGSLLVGLVAAKALCVARDIPLVAVNHLQAHIYACRMAAAPQEVFPCVGLIVSGGHTSLYRCLGPLDFELLGATIDDAAGEAFDKVASMLGLPYPGGPAIARAAADGNPRAYALPRSFFQDDDRLDFSFSGLKTAVRYTIVGPGRPDFTRLELDPRQVADLAASFQEAVVDAWWTRRLRPCGRRGCGFCAWAAAWRPMPGCASDWQEEAGRRDVQLHVAPLRLCTDNAVMGAIAVERLKAGLVESLDLEVYPGVVRATG